jgi:GNAT superfamily N-acetyltransferase
MRENDRYGVVQWVGPSDDLLAYHPKHALMAASTAAESHSVQIGYTQFEGFEPIYCAECRDLIGYYDPTVQPEDAIRLQKMVDDAFRNAITNGFELQMYGDSLDGVANDMIDHDAEIAEIVEQDLVGGENMMAVEIARQKFPRLKAVTSSTYVGVVTGNTPTILSLAEATDMLLGDGSWYINRIKVANKLQGQGIGGQILERLKEEVAKQGCQVLIVEPGGYDGDTERQWSFYVKHGFVKVEDHLEWRPQVAAVESAS